MAGYFHAVTACPVFSIDIFNRDQGICVPVFTAIHTGSKCSDAHPDHVDDEHSDEDSPEPSPPPASAGFGSSMHGRHRIERTAFRHIFGVSAVMEQFSTFIKPFFSSCAAIRQSGTAAWYYNIEYPVIFQGVRANFRQNMMRSFRSGTAKEIRAFRIFPVEKSKGDCIFSYKDAAALFRRKPGAAAH